MTPPSRQAPATGGPDNIVTTRTHKWRRQIWNDDMTCAPKSIDCGRKHRFPALQTNSYACSSGISLLLAIVIYILSFTFRSNFLCTVVNDRRAFSKLVFSLSRCIVVAINLQHFQPLKGWWNGFIFPMHSLNPEHWWITSASFHSGCVHNFDAVHLCCTG